MCGECSLRKRAVPGTAAELSVIAPRPHHAGESRVGSAFGFYQWHFSFATALTSSSSYTIREEGRSSITPQLVKTLVVFPSRGRVVVAPFLFPCKQNFSVSNAREEPVSAKDVEKPLMSITAARGRIQSTCKKQIQDWHELNRYVPKQASGNEEVPAARQPLQQPKLCTRISRT